jgi:peroxiredoxin
VGEFPPYRLFYDPGLVLTEQLGIGGGNKAKPTTILIDKSGIVQYAYTGMDRSDRPAVRDLRRLLETLSR